MVLIVLTVWKNVGFGVQKQFQFCPSHLISLALSDLEGTDMKRAQNLVIRNCKRSTLIFPFSNTHAYAHNEEK